MSKVSIQQFVDERRVSKPRRGNDRLERSSCSRTCDVNVNQFQIISSAFYLGFSCELLVIFSAKREDPQFLKLAQ